MKRIPKLIVSLAILAFSVVMLTVGVYATVTSSVSVTASVGYAIGNNIYITVSGQAYIVDAIGDAVSISKKAGVTFAGTTFTSRDSQQEASWSAFTLASPANLNPTNEIVWVISVKCEGANAVKVITTLESLPSVTSCTIKNGTASATSLAVSGTSTSGAITTNSTMQIELRVHLTSYMTNISAEQGNMAFSVEIKNNSL